MMQIAAVNGSLKKNSGNLLLLEAIKASAPPSVEVRIGDHLRHLPLFNPDLEGINFEWPAAAASASGPGFLTSVHRWRRFLAQSDVVLVASPEYGHSLSGALKNGIDWVIGSGELQEKKIAITTAVAHPDRGLQGLAALQQTLLAVDARLLFNAPLVRGETLAKQLQVLWSSLLQ